MKHLTILLTLEMYVPYFVLKAHGFLFANATTLLAKVKLRNESLACS